jgi:nucleoside-diphosphate-sugar epimerase
VAEVVTPFRDLRHLHATNVVGTVNLLEVFSPRVFVMASSSAVYGHGGTPRVGTDWRFVRPVGAYGMSKAAAELVCADWARETGRAAISFRFGNVIGPRCRGLIPYLVDHARRHPDGEVPAAMRGRGRLLRDYIPVSYIVRLLRAAAALRWPAGTAEAFNIGTGRGTTNGAVARRVAQILRRYGYRLRVDMSHPIAPGESRHVVLDMRRTVRRFEVPPPTPAEVDEAIEAAVRHRLEAPL